MCGIVGSTKKNVNIEKALDSIAHRGPDGRKSVLLEECVMGFVRLAIRDISERAMQPMGNDSEGVYIVYNGEIYGIDDLKIELQHRGHIFKTSSDTEVILNAYLEYGESFDDYIDGIFAIGIW